MSIPIKQLLDERSMSNLQYTTIFICFLMNILDGMDVLVISFCAPAIAESWDMGPEALGIVFSAGLLGMTLGAIVLAPYADKIGRKKMILISALIMGISIFLTGFSETVFQLIVLRFISGLGIGSMLASTAALTSEFAPNKSKDFWVSFVLAGYPLGAIITGYLAAAIVPVNGWQMLFKIAGIASVVALPFIYFFLSESIVFYLKKQPKQALEKVNRILNKMTLEPIQILPEKASKSEGIPVKKLFSKDYKLATFQLWTALFFAFGCLYFLLSWIPKLASDAGLTLKLAIYAGTIFNMGAFVGILIQGYISSKIGLNKTISIFLIGTAILMLSFQIFIGSYWLLVVFGLLGFALQGGFVGLYAIAARMYPTEFRTTGVGRAIGAGRLGGVIGPALGGVFVGMGLSMATNFMIFAIPTLAAGIVTYYISSKDIS